MGVAGGDGRRTARSQGECSESRIEGGIDNHKFSDLQTLSQNMRHTGSVGQCPVPADLVRYYRTMSGYNGLCPPDSLRQRNSKTST
jgi:hypothetical protein